MNTSTTSTTSKIVRLEASAARLRRGTVALALTSTLILTGIAIGEATRPHVLQSDQLRSGRVEVVDAQGRVVAALADSLELFDANRQVRIAELSVSGGLVLGGPSGAIVRLGHLAGQGFLAAYAPGDAPAAVLASRSGGVLEVGNSGEEEETLARIGSADGRPEVVLRTNDGRRVVEIASPRGDSHVTVWGGARAAVSFGATAGDVGYLSTAAGGEASVAQIYAGVDQYGGVRLKDSAGKATVTASSDLGETGGRLLVSSTTDAFAGVELAFDSSRRPYVQLVNAGGDAWEHDLDRRLLGSWNWSERDSDTEYGGGGTWSTSITTFETFTFEMDGTVTEKDQTYMSSNYSGSEPGDYFNSADKSDPTYKHGRWSSSGGVLTIDWDGGSRYVIDYSINGRFLHLTYGTGLKRVMSRG